MKVQILAEDMQVICCPCKHNTRLGADAKVCHALNDRQTTLKLMSTQTASSGMCCSLCSDWAELGPGRLRFACLQEDLES